MIYRKQLWTSWFLLTDILTWTLLELSRWWSLWWPSEELQAELQCRLHYCSNTHFWFQQTSCRLTWLRLRRWGRTGSRGRWTVSAGPGAPQSPPGPACRERCPPSPWQQAPGPGCRAPPGRSPSRSSGAPGREGGCQETPVIYQYADVFIDRQDYDSELKYRRILLQYLQLLTFCKVNDLIIKT